MSGTPVAPIPAARPVSSTLHGITRTDEYAWLRGKDDPEVMAHLEAENAYTAALTAATVDLQESLFQEIKARIQETDLSVPVKKGPWAYVTRTVEGSQYAIHTRRPRASANDESAEVVLLDENVVADGHDYFALGTFDPSPDHQWVAWAIDTNGSEQYELRFRNLTTGEDSAEVVGPVAPGSAWAADSATVFYATLDDVMRPYRLWRHHVGTDQAADVMVFEEPDERFFLGVGVSATDEFLVLTLGSQVTTEVHLLRATAAVDPSARFSVVEPRRHGIEYGVDHHRAADGTERLIIVTNDGSDGFRLMTAPVDTPGAAQWSDCGLHPATDEPYPLKLDGVDVFIRHLVLHERADALERLRVVDLDDHGTIGDVRVLSMAEPVYSVWSGGNAEFDTHVLRFGYTSPVTPSTVFEEDLVSGDRVVLKRQPVLGPFDPEAYTCERVWAPAPDGELVPVSVVHRRDTPVDGTAPLLLYGYGAYEISIDPTFSSLRLSLLDRGFVFAIAHIRGGGERGRRWYLDGKFLAKPTTFSDFIAVGDHLASVGYADPHRIVARGGSAGGLLMGAVINARPDRWCAVVAEVPFVDVVNTMLDDTLPLTAIEWDEWGNPAEPEFYACMSSYAPYENVAAVDHPQILATGGLNDPRVGFWEPAKWVARLRERGTGTNRILLKMEMGAGHGGPTGRYSVWRDEAFVLSFILTSVGITT